MLADKKYHINSGEIYVHESTAWQNDFALRKYIEELETHILHILRSNNIPAVTSKTHNVDYFRTKREQFENYLLKAREEENPPFTYIFVEGEPDWKLYSYTEPYNITRSDENQDVFGFFYAFKLRQIDLMETDEFLRFHQEESFSNNRKYSRFLDLILRKYKELFETDKLNTVREWIAINQSTGEDESAIMKNTDRIEWQGSQKELAELFIELKKKGWIKEIEHNLITQAFTKSETIQQILKPAKDKHTLEDTYEQVYTKAYRPRFHNILKRK